MGMIKVRLKPGVSSIANNFFELTPGIVAEIPDNYFEGSVMDRIDPEPVVVVQQPKPVEVPVQPKPAPQPEVVKSASIDLNKAAKVVPK